MLLWEMLRSQKQRLLLFWSPRTCGKCQIGQLLRWNPTSPRRLSLLSLHANLRVLTVAVSLMSWYWRHRFDYSASGLSWGPELSWSKHGSGLRWNLSESHSREVPHPEEPCPRRKACRRVSRGTLHWSPALRVTIARDGHSLNSKKPKQLTKSWDLPNPHLGAP